MRRIFWTPSACRSSQSLGAPDLIRDLRDAKRQAAPFRVKAPIEPPPPTPEQAVSQEPRVAIQWVAGVQREEGPQERQLLPEMGMHAAVALRPLHGLRLQATLRGASLSRKGRRVAQELA